MENIYIRERLVLAFISVEGVVISLKTLTHVVESVVQVSLLHNKLWASCITCVAISLVWAPEVRSLAVVSRDFVGVIS